MIDSSGVGVYLRGILPFLLRSNNRFILLGNTVKLQPFTGNANVQIIECAARPFSLKELFFFPKQIIRAINNADLFYSPFFNIPGGIKVPVYTTIHDIIFPDMPSLTSKAALAARMFFYRRAFSKSRTIFTVSEFSKSRIEHYSRHKVPVIVTHIAIQSWILEKGKTNNVKNNSVVFIGNIKKHKGLDTLLDAFLAAKNEDLSHRLIIIGEKENFRSSDNAILRKIESIGSDSVTFTGFICDDKLLEYLTQAALLVQPSLYEGFGLPPLEAMFLGTKALISDIPVFTEIYADFPVTFFRAGDSEDLKEKMLCLLLNQVPQSVSLPAHLSEKYTFEKTSSVILGSIQAVSQ
jgi:glycosyltransferase involved in cell wall biosynthesis